jgi:hypothetical protein
MTLFRLSPLLLQLMTGMLVKQTMTSQSTHQRVTL